MDLPGEEFLSRPRLAEDQDRKPRPGNSPDLVDGLLRLLVLRHERRCRSGRFFRRERRGERLESRGEEGAGRGETCSRRGPTAQVQERGRRHGGRTSRGNAPAIRAAARPPPPRPARPRDALRGCEAPPVGAPSPSGDPPPPRGGAARKNRARGRRARSRVRGLRVPKRGDEAGAARSARDCREALRPFRDASAPPPRIGSKGAVPLRGSGSHARRDARSRRRRAPRPRERRPRPPPDRRRAARGAGAARPRRDTGARGRLPIRAEGRRTASRAPRRTFRTEARGRSGFRGPKGSAPRLPPRRRARARKRDPPPHRRSRRQETTPWPRRGGRRPGSASRSRDRARGGKGRVPP